MSVADLVRGKNVIVVGPAGYLMDSGLGQWIDSFDVVVRLNWGVPVPEGLEQHVGSRTDILYKRLLKLGKIDAIDIEEFLAAGLKHIVAVDRLQDSADMKVFKETIGDRIPWSTGGHVRQHLRQLLGTSPLIGVIAIEHLLNTEAKSVTVTGCDFYQSGYYVGYGGRAYRQSKKRKEGTIAAAHDGRRQLSYLMTIEQRDARLKFDDVLTRIAAKSVKGQLGHTRNVVIIIPARAGSSRFPNKPLALINGKPMILHVCDRLVGLGWRMIVATDSQMIRDTVKAAGYEAVMTNKASTGTDRIAEVALGIPDHYIIVNVQGDEPLIDKEDVRRIASAKQTYRESVIAAVAPLPAARCDDPTAVKVAWDPPTGKLYYASRAPGFSKWQQVGIYAFTKHHLRKFSAHGRTGHAEVSEDVELLRFLDLGVRVHVVPLKTAHQAVDLPEHVQVIEDALHVM